MLPSQEASAHAHAILAEAQSKIDALRRIDPYLIDLSLRENPVGARIEPEQLLRLFARASGA